MQIEHDQISIDERNGATVLTLSGQFLGGEETDQLKLILSELADNMKPAVMDMNAVSFVNSSFLGSLLSAHTHAERRGTHLVLANVKQSILQIIALTRMDKVLDIRSSLEDAIQSSNTNS